MKFKWNNFGILFIYCKKFFVYKVYVHFSVVRPHFPTEAAILADEHDDIRTVNFEDRPAEQWNQEVC